MVPDVLCEIFIERGMAFVHSSHICYHCACIMISQFAYCTEHNAFINAQHSEIKLLANWLTFPSDRKGIQKVFDRRDFFFCPCTTILLLSLSQYNEYTVFKDKYSDPLSDLKLKVGMTHISAARATTVRHLPGLCFFIS